MDFTALLQYLPYITSLISIAPNVKKWIDIGLPIVTELQKADPKLIPVLEQAGTNLFPQLTDTIHKVAAAADAIFDPHGTMWFQGKLNALAAAGDFAIPAPLEVDGKYGQKTKDAVAAFQTAHQPDAGTVDGWAGPKTEAAITAALTKRGLAL